MKFVFIFDQNQKSLAISYRAYMCFTAVDIEQNFKLF